MITTNLEEMMLLLRNAALILLTALLGACATPMRVSLAPEQRAKLTELKAHVVVVQDEVIAAVEPSNVSLALGGGLIGAMIDSSITNSRVKASQEVMGQFYASIEDLDYRKDFNTSVPRELAGYPIKVTQVTTTPLALTQAELNRMRDELQPGQALLVIWPRYFLTMDFKNLDSETVVSIWTKGSQDNTPAQRAVLHYQSQLVGPGGKESILMWSDQNAARFRDAVRESIVETLALASTDLNLTEPAAKPGEPLQTFAFNTGAQISQMKGRMVKETATRVIVLAQDQKLYSLPKSPTQAATAAGQ